ncbi:MAG TPA: transketolase, partial [Richelia sp.]|nr:transketolase [Richelia sp.]
MSVEKSQTNIIIPNFYEGIRYFGETLPDFDKYGVKAAIDRITGTITSPTDPAAIYQTLLLADALRYLTLQITGSKASGHPGGFASQAEVYAALVMLGH